MFTVPYLIRNIFVKWAIQSAFGSQFSPLSNSSPERCFPTCVTNSVFSGVKHRRRQKKGNRQPSTSAESRLSGTLRHRRTNETNLNDSTRSLAFRTAPGCACSKVGRAALLSAPPGDPYTAPDSPRAPCWLHSPLNIALSMLN